MNTLLLITLAQCAQDAPPLDARVHALQLQVRDVAASAAFYERALGFTTDWTCPQGLAAELHNGPARLLLARSEQPAPAGDDWRPSLNYVVADFAASSAAVRAAGGTVDAGEPRRFPLGLSLPFHDPDGHPGRLLTLDQNPPAAGSAPRVYNLAVIAQDMAAAEKFYTGLGFEVYSHDYLPLAIPLRPKGAFSLLLHCPPAGAPAPSARAALVLTVPDLAAARARLCPEKASACCGDRELAVADPTGNRVLLHAEPQASVVPAAVTRVSGGAADSSSAAAAFERMKSLVGTWEAKSTKGWTGTEKFELIAEGSVLMQTTRIEPHPNQTMVTMYHLDGDRLLLTHYCVAKNQPRLVASALSADGGKLTFRFLDGTNLKSRDQGHMDQAVFEFVDADHFRDQWTWYQDGKESWMEQVEYVRKD